MKAQVRLLSNKGDSAREPDEMDVTWFRHNDEHRNDLLRFGLMRLSRLGQINYSERPLAQAHAFSIDVDFNPPPHHVSLIVIDVHGQRTKCAVDSEDSFYWMSSIIERVDTYFCAGYNSQFFEGREFPIPYDWQSEDDVAFYRARAADLIDTYSAHFRKVRRFVPIGPNMGSSENLSLFRRKARNARYRIGQARSESLYWALDFEAYERRYANLMSLRQTSLQYDIVLNDSLWGWPMHRVRLHRRLADLASAYKIRSRLNWAPPLACDGSDRLNLIPADFPMITGVIENYESMLAGSRLGVFATGFHWGWRNIMTLAMLLGIPILADRPMLEPWFDLSSFELNFNDDHEWADIKAILSSITDESWLVRKQRAQILYDEFMSPEAVARYFLSAATVQKSGV